jgi:glucose dehydrogenase
MANLAIKAEVANLMGAAPPALTSFTDESGRQMTAMPKLAEIDGEEVVLWTVPDTPANRGMFKRHYKGGLYSCESEDMETPVPFNETTVSYAGATVPNAKAAKAKGAKAKK